MEYGQAFFRKKPVRIEAKQFNGLDCDRMNLWLAEKGYVVRVSPLGFHINTLEGLMRVNQTDWVICGVKGEIYPCRDDIFRETYLPATPAVEGVTKGSGE